MEKITDKFYDLVGFCFEGERSKPELLNINQDDNKMEKMYEKYFQQCIKCFIKFMKKCAQSRKNCSVETNLVTYFRWCEHSAK